VTQVSGCRLCQERRMRAIIPSDRAATTNQPSIGSEMSAAASAIISKAVLSERRGQSVTGLAESCFGWLIRVCTCTLRL
jgi:hypothetical protein